MVRIIGFFHIFRVDSIGYRKNNWPDVPTGAGAVTERRGKGRREARARLLFLGT
jgi:hypothetical protein